MRKGIWVKGFIYCGGYCLFSPACHQQWQVLLKKGRRKKKENENGKGREVKKGVHKIVVGTSGALVFGLSDEFLMCLLIQPEG